MSLATTSALLCAVAAFAVITLASRRRRRRISPGLLFQPSAGMRSLADHVGSSTTLGMGLRLPDPGEGWRRLGSLLGLR